MMVSHVFFIGALLSSWHSNCETCYFQDLDWPTVIRARKVAINLNIHIVGKVTIDINIRNIIARRACYICVRALTLHEFRVGDLVLVELLAHLMFDCLHIGNINLQDMFDPLRASDACMDSIARLAIIDVPAR